VEIVYFQKVGFREGRQRKAKRRLRIKHEKQHLTSALEKKVKFGNRKMIGKDIHWLQVITSTY
jgi:hypothetical protein